MADVFVVLHAQENSQNQHCMRACTCAYIQLDEGSEQGMAADADDGEEEEEVLTAELRLVPAEEAAGAFV
jgi:hypothetical protein